MSPSAQQVHGSQSSWLVELQEKATNVGVAGLYAAGLVLAFSQEMLAQNPVRLWLPVAVLLLTGGIALLLRWTPPVARTLLIITMAALTVLIVNPGGIAVAAPLLGLTVLLAGLVISMRVSLLTALLLTLVLYARSPLLPALGVAERTATLIAIWGAAGLQWLVLHHLSWTVHWAWSGYHENRAALERARDLQVQLFETMEDLSGANAQLTRLNQLANNLRQVAEDERQAKQQFVANVSHELRTPLNMIIGFCEMITQSPRMYGEDVPPKLLADLTVVLRNGQHLSELINDVLDLSQVDAGMMALSKERCSLRDIVNSAVLAVQPLFRSKQLSLEVEMPSDLPMLYCDRTRIREVVLNVLSNAGRYTEEGGCRISVRRQGGDLAISVSDTGPGIAPEAQKRIFRPFEQIDGTLRRRYGGTGLGLSISKSFVELHGGRMSLASAPGRGTTIHIVLPIETPTAVDPGALRWFNPHRPYEERTRPTRFRPEAVRARLVVVEQGEAMGRLLDRYVDQVEVVTARSLAEAREEVMQNPALAILINDLDVGSALKNLGSDAPLPPGIPIMVCGIPATEDAASLPGVSAYLLKPVSRARMLQALDALPGPIESLLLIDDEPDALHLFRRMLSSAERGYRVMRASSGVRGLQILANQHPDVVLLDLAMPDMDGYGFLQAKNEDPALRDIPVILVSARDPLGHPLVSNALAVTSDRGLSVRRLLAAIGALTEVLSPTAAREPGQIAAPHG
jgi:signal transduction histidine kinase/CheY-like chemotaxis protein